MPRGVQNKRGRTGQPASNKQTPGKSTASPNKTPQNKSPSKNKPPKRPRPSDVESPSTSRGAPSGAAKRKSGPVAHRVRPGTRALKEIRKFQKTGDLLIPKLPFSRVIRDIVQTMGRMDLRFQAVAIAAIQEAAETFLVELFEDSVLCMVHGKRVTLHVEDMFLAQRIWKRFAV